MITRRYQDPVREYPYCFKGKDSTPFLPFERSYGNIFTKNYTFCGKTLKKADKNHELCMVTQSLLFKTFYRNNIKIKT